MNHKRGRARNQRAGCKLCKPWKVNGFRTERADGERFSDHRRRSLVVLDLSEHDPREVDDVSELGVVKALEELHGYWQRP